MPAETLPAPVEATEEKIKEAFEKNWNVIVWNDPVNQMSYVVFVFMKVLAFPKEKATKHMLEVHNNGKSCVATETREKAELYFQQLQGYGRRRCRDLQQRVTILLAQGRLIADQRNGRSCRGDAHQQVVARFADVQRAREEWTSVRSSEAEPARHSRGTGVD